MLNLFAKISLVDFDIVIDNFGEISKLLQTEKRQKPRKLQMCDLC